MQLVSTLCFLLIARIHAGNVGGPKGLSLRGAESVNAGPTEGDQGEDERSGLVGDPKGLSLKGAESINAVPTEGDQGEDERRALGACHNILRWVDSDGDGCDSYARNNWCSRYGNGYFNNHHTANTACCACGGGYCWVTENYTYPPSGGSWQRC
jgi:hypothetical protein